MNKKKNMSSYLRGHGPGSRTGGGKSGRRWGGLLLSESTEPFSLNVKRGKRKKNGQAPPKKKRTKKQRVDSKRRRKGSVW